MPLKTQRDAACFGVADGLRALNAADVARGQSKRQLDTIATAFPHSHMTDSNPQGPLRKGADPERVRLVPAGDARQQNNPKQTHRRTDKQNNTARAR